MRNNNFIRPVRQPQSSMGTYSTRSVSSFEEPHQVIKQQHFIWTLGAEISNSDQTTALVFPLNTLVGEKKKILEIDTIKMQMLNFTETNYPQFVALYWKSLDGYLDNSNRPTHLIGVAYSDALINYGTGNKNILYSNNNSTSWDVTGISSMNLKIVTSDNIQDPILMPLNYTLIVQGKIVRKIN